MNITITTNTSPIDQTAFLTPVSKSFASGGSGGGGTPIVINPNNPIASVSGAIDGITPVYGDTVLVDTNLTLYGSRTLSAWVNFFSGFQTKGGTYTYYYSGNATFHLKINNVIKDSFSINAVQSASGTLGCPWEYIIPLMLKTTTTGITGLTNVKVVCSSAVQVQDVGGPPINVSWSTINNGRFTVMEF